MRIDEVNRKIIEDEIASIEAKNKKTVSDVAICQILKGMLDNDILPWEKSFDTPAISAITLKPYQGINRILLSGGEYITVNQITAYNIKNGTHFKLSAPSDEDDFITRLGKSRQIIVHYNEKPPRKATDKEIAKVEANEIVPYLFKDEETGEYLVRQPATMSYFGVYNTAYIYDEETGEQFPQHNIQDNKKRCDGEAIIEHYKNKSGVKFEYDTPGRCCFVPKYDTIHMSPIETFKDAGGLDAVAEYYASVFHEMGHSTGMPQRLNRDSFKDYDFSAGSNKIIYSMEELVAEFTAAFVLGELNIDAEIKSRVMQNNTAYIAGWFRYLKNDDNSVSKYYSGKGFEKMIYAIRQAEKAYQYIMEGLVELPKYEKKDTYTICQLRRLKENKDLMFKKYSDLEDEPIFSSYKKVFYGNIEDLKINSNDIGGMLEKLFEMFNLHIPEGFTGHYLSVSDVILLEIGGKKKAFYVDNIGFKELGSFFRKENKDKVKKKSTRKTKSK